MRAVSLQVRALELLHYYSVFGVLDDRVVPVLEGIARPHVVFAESVDLLYVLFHEVIDELGVLSDKFSESFLGVSLEGSNLSLVVLLDVLNEVGICL